jgi:archaellum component FlaF (FlaF/FlaG flagellin family)
MSHQIELKELLESKAFVKEGSGYDFKLPEQYVNEFLDIAGNYTDKFLVTVNSPTENKNEDESINKAFPRFLVEAKMPEKFDVEESTATIGFMMALDTQKPIAKLYTGKKVIACMNLTIFNADNVYSAELGNLGSVFKKGFQYFQDVEKDNAEYAEIVKTLKNTELDNAGIQQVMGKLLLEATKNKFIGNTIVNAAAKELVTKNSTYAIKDNKSTLWNILNAHTAYISTKTDISERAIKTVTLANLIRKINTSLN